MVVSHPLDRLSLAVLEASRRGYSPSPRLREALEHLSDQLDMPAPSEPARPASPSWPSTAVPERPRLLVYSNAHTLRQYVGACLRGAFRFDEASDLTRDVAQPSFFVPDLVITDLVTLETTHFSLFSLREPGQPLASVPLLLLSQEPSTRLLYGPGVGPDAVLPIPTAPDTLRATVRQMTPHL